MSSPGTTLSDAPLDAPVLRPLDVCLPHTTRPYWGRVFHARNVTLAELELELGRERQADTVARREYI